MTVFRLSYPEPTEADAAELRDIECDHGVPMADCRDCMGDALAEIADAVRDRRVLTVTTGRRAA